MKHITDMKQDKVFNDLVRYFKILEKIIVKTSGLLGLEHWHELCISLFPFPSNITHLHKFIQHVLISNKT